MSVFLESVLDLARGFIVAGAILFAGFMAWALVAGGERIDRDTRRRVDKWDRGL